MKRAIVIAIDAALCAVVATGCATRSPGPHIQPVLEVRHSGIQPDGYYQLGRFLQEQQRHDEAAAAYRKALALDPWHANAHNGLGTVLALQNRFDEAHREFAAALLEQPDNASVLNNIGYAFLLEHRASEAIPPLTRATELAPENARYASNLVAALNKQPPAPAAVPAAHGTPGTFDAVPASPRPAGESALRTAQATGAVRLVAIGPNAFELVVPAQFAPKTALAALPTSHGRLAVEVSNGNGTAGMARRVSQQLKGAGVRVTRLTNHLPYGAITSRVEYRPGHRGAALGLSGRVPGRPPIVASVALRKDVDVRLVLGREVPVDVTLLPPAEQFAHYDGARAD